jgi:RHS repeat-associated protein
MKKLLHRVSKGNRVKNPFRFGSLAIGLFTAAAAFGQQVGKMHHHNWSVCCDAAAWPGSPCTEDLPLYIGTNMFDAALYNNTICGLSGFSISDDVITPIHIQYFKVMTDGSLATMDFSPDRGASDLGPGCYTVYPNDYWDGIIVGPGECSDCAGGEGACMPGSMTPGLGSVNVSISLGKAAYGERAGHLTIVTNAASQVLSTPAALRWAVFYDPNPYAYDRVQVVTVTNAQTLVLRQVLAPQAEVDIVVSNDFRYDIKFYLPGSFGSQDSYGVYSVSGSPFATITVENPDASTNTYNRLRITESGDFGTRQSEYVWTESSNQWQLATGNGLRKETRVAVWDATQSVRTETNVVQNADDTVAFKQIEKYKAFAWGKTDLIERIVDPDGTTPLTNLWVYYEDQGNDANSSNNYTRLQMKVEPRGYWERYEYDASGRKTKIVAQFLDAATNAMENLCRVTTYGYADPATHTNNYPNIVPQTTNVVTLLGQEVQRSYRVWLSETRIEIQCATPGAAWTAADNLVTTTKRYGTVAGGAASVTRPDGTVTHYDYVLGDPVDEEPESTTISVGLATADGSSVTNGTKNVSLTDRRGNTISEQTYDIASGLLLSESVMTSSDAFGRSIETVHLDGIATVNYGCCGIASTTDQEGITTSYTYDELKRVVATTRAGITTSNAYDAAGRVLARFRNGVRMNSDTYDTAGRMTSSTDALTNTTSYAESFDANGHLVKTTTYPNQTMRIETYYKDGSLFSVTGSAVHGVRYEYGVEQESGVYRRYTWEIKLDANGNDTSEWTKTYFDMVDRAYKTVYADGSYGQSFYNNKGQLWKQRDPDRVVTLFAYNDRGELETTAIDMDRDDVIDYDGTDRITRTTTQVLSEPQKGTITRETTSVWIADNADVAETVSVNDASADGLQSWNISYGLTNSVQTVYNGNGQRTVTTTNPDLSYSIAQYQDGRLMTNTVYDALGSQLSAVSYRYDGAGRLQTQTDARTGDTSFTYNNADQRLSASISGQTTSYAYDSMGRVTRVMLPDNGIVMTEYHPTGELKKTYGARTYPVEYDYDYAGRMKTNKTWKIYPTGDPTTTTWKYDEQRGFLTEKIYDGKSSGVTYTNSAAGRLLGRTWERGITTTYGYNYAGDLGTITYSDGTTPNVSFGYDRRGRRTSASSASSVVNFSYNSAGQLTNEGWTSGPLSGISVISGYDSLLHRSSVTLTTNQLPLTSATYGYDAASRLNAVTNGTYTASYVYLPNSPLVSNIVFKTGGATKMTTTRNWDNLNRLTSINSSAPNAFGVSSHSYTYNFANQRTRVDLADGSYWMYEYDSLGQVVSGRKYWSDGSEVAGQQFGYDFDDIGNRETSTLNSRLSTYSANSLNQYTQRTVPGYVWELGSAASNATVTINNQSVSRHGEYFSKEFSVANSSSAVYTQLTTVGVLKNGGGDTNQPDIVSMETGSVFVAKSPELFGYDSDGNLTNDGRWAYSWDAENRLISMETDTSKVGAASVPRQKLLFGYDWQSRRISKVVSNWTSSSWVCTNSLRFVYDGWNLIAEQSAIGSQLSAIRSYVWGLDLSGSQQGAGGIGGLLLISTHGSPVTNSFVAFDGNGNVMALVDASTGSNTADYAYGPFGEFLRATGPMAKANPFRFSTKYQDDETDLLYYGYRYYNASTGRWLSRDPIQEQGGIDLYLFVSNQPLTLVDAVGLVTEGAPCCCNYSTGKPLLAADLVASASGYDVTFTASNVRNVAGGCYADVQAFWTTCYEGTDRPHWGAPGFVYGKTYNPYKADGGFRINSSFKINYFTCDPATGTWQKRHQRGGGPWCLWTYKIYGFAWGYWDCESIIGWTGGGTVHNGWEEPRRR